MPLGVREVLLVVRAQNMSSGVLRNIAGDFNTLDKNAKKSAQTAMQQGQALMAIGAGIAAVGAAGIAFLAKATSDAVDYNRQVALTKTQMFGVKATFDQVAQAGLDVASKIAVPLDQIQGGLYDIFSSMDVNMSQAKYLLTNFSKEAVAGQVDLSTAERASIGIMNAYGMKVQDVTKVQDIMFNLVKYGVGTYADFANSIGRVTGPAVRANQTFDQTAALMAFTTRNGLSASNAASSVGRALDAIGKSRDKIQNFGQIVVGALGEKTASKLGITKDSIIKITDAGGKLLPINVIMTNLGKALKGLNPTQLNDVLTEMFKGTGGTIQAMRFIDIAVHNFGQLNQITKEMGNSKGALQAAYKTMANTPAAQIQLLKNNFHVLMIEIGNVLLPVLNKFVIKLKDVFEWVGKIPHRFIVIGTAVVAIVSVLLVLSGIVLMVAGAWIVLSTILAASEVALLPLLGTIALVIAVVAGLAVAAYFIYKNWGPISTWFHNMWFDMWHWIDHIWQNIWGSITKAWDKVKGVFLSIQSFITGSFDKWWTTHGDALKQVWSGVWSEISGTFKSVWDTILGAAKIVWGIFGGTAKAAWDTIAALFKVAWDEIVTIFKIAWAIIVGAFKLWFTALETAAKIAWAAIQMIFKTVWDILVAAFSIFLDLLTGHWHQAWVDLLTVGHQIWNNISAFLKATWSAIVSGAKSAGGIFASIWINIWHAVYDGAHSVWNDIWGFLHKIWGDITQGAKTVVSGLKDIWAGIETAFKGPANFVIQYVYDDGIRALWNGVMGAIGLGKFDLPFVKTFSSGGRLGGFGGGDVVPALLEPGEAVVDKYKTKKYAALFAAMGVPGFASGGVIGSAIDIGKMLLAATTGNPTAFINALTDMTGGTGGAAGEFAAMIATLPVAMMKKAVSAIWSSITSASKMTMQAQAGPGGGTALQNQALAKQLMPAWASGAIWGAWLNLWNRESGWNQFAMNPTSSAYGIPQALPYTKMPKAAWPASAGGSSNPRAQETWGIGYIEGRYGTPVQAWIHEMAYNWYGNGFSGTFSTPTLIGVGDGGPEDVTITPRRKGGHGPTQNFYITTQEINPRYHAAQLGFELSRRSG